MRKLKILALKFKYLGDIAVATPALRALRQHFPEAELHILVAQDAYPIVAHLPWVDKVWSIPRNRSSAEFSMTWPILKELRKQKFNISIDFVSNDRGALLSFLIGAKKRIGIRAPKGFWGRRFLYTQTIEEADFTKHESIRDILVLEPLGVPPPENLEIEIRTNPFLLDYGEVLLLDHYVMCHLSTSQPKKECSIEFWVELCDRLEAQDVNVIVSTGPSEREQELLKALVKERPHLRILPKQISLEHFLAAVNRVKLFICCDTAPLHLAAGLGVPTVGLFGPTASSRWAPLGPKHLAIQAPKPCVCSGHAHVCYQKVRCIDTLKADFVFQKVLDHMNALNITHLLSSSYKIG